MKKTIHEAQAFFAEIENVFSDFALILAQHKNERSTNPVFIFPGNGEHNRIGTALYELCEPGGQVFIAGDDPAKSGILLKRDSDLMVPPFFLNKDLMRRSHHTFQGAAQNTREQAAWAARHIKREHTHNRYTINWIPRLATSYYHLPRAYMTLVAELLRIYPDRDNPPPRIMPATTSHNPHELVPAALKPANTMIGGEIERIIEYRERGHVATHDQLMDYLRRAITNGVR